MTTPRDDEHLDQLLADWDSQSDAPSRLENLHQQILAAAVEGRSETTRNQPASLTLAGAMTGFGAGQCVRFEPKGWTAQLVVAVAAMLLVSLGVFLGTELREPATVTLAETPPESAWLRDDQLQNKADLLAEMETLFDGQLAWLAEDGRRVELGLSDSSAASASESSDNRRVAIRLVVVRREDSTADWQVAWAMDVSARQEERIRVASSEQPNDTVQLWSYELPDGLIAVDCSLKLGGDLQLDTESSALCRNGQPQQILETRHAGAEYRVFQTVAVLNPEVG
jgi:hypothetical protein